MKTQSFGRTEVGCVRSNNEDSFFADDSLGLYIVCDGMGGHDGGEVASMTAISAVASCFRNRRGEIMGLPIRGQDRMLQQLIVDAIADANAEICFLADRSECFKEMGTTITLLAVHDGVGVIGHCGDSRAYRVGSRIELLTHDHTLETELRAQGMQGDGPSRYGHLLTRVLGRHDFAAPDMQTFRVAPGARFLLCSDGLSRYLPDYNLNSIYREDRQTFVDRLMELAQHSGGVDNITAIVIDVEDSQPNTNSSRW